ncbi:MAG: hypothetical protein VKO39_09220 [Cyanobacteriota bacterium]|nr:hypothetical protein [Cyanobacteriota bacterium]
MDISNRDRLLKPIFPAVVLLAATALIGSAHPAKSVCLSSSGENNCSSFSGDTLSQVTQTYTSSNLISNKFFQMGFRSSTGGAYTINNLAYSTNGSSFTTISGSVSTTASFQYINIQNPFGVNPMTIPFYVRYDILAGVPIGVTIDSMFLANNAGTSTGGVLNFEGGDFQAIERSHTAVAPVPAPLPLLGTAVLFPCINRLQRATQKLRRNQ